MGHIYCKRWMPAPTSVYNSPIRMKVLYIPLYSLETKRKLLCFVYFHIHRFFFSSCFLLPTNLSRVTMPRGKKVEVEEANGQRCAAPDMRRRCGGETSRSLGLNSYDHGPSGFSEAPLTPQYFRYRGFLTHNQTAVHKCCVVHRARTQYEDHEHDHGIPITAA